MAKQFCGDREEFISNYLKEKGFVSKSELIKLLASEEKVSEDTATKSLDKMRLNTQVVCRKENKIICISDTFCENNTPIKGVCPYGRQVYAPICEKYGDVRQYTRHCKKILQEFETLRSQ